MLETGHMKVCNLACFFYPKKPSSITDFAIWMKVKEVVPYYLMLKLYKPVLTWGISRVTGICLAVFFSITFVLGVDSTGGQVDKGRPRVRGTTG